MLSALKYNVERRRRYARDRLLSDLWMKKVYSINNLRHEWVCWALSFHASSIILERTGRSWKNRFRIGGMWSQATEMGPAALPSVIVHAIEVEKQRLIDYRYVLEVLDGNPT